MFPPADNDITREVLLNPSSIAFLNQHNMNFNTWTKEGVSFVSSEAAEELLSKYQKKELERQEKNAEAKKSGSSPKGGSSSSRPGQRRVELRRTEDIDFHARAMAALREWLDSAHPMNPFAPGDNDNNNNPPAGGVGQSEVPEGLSFLLPPTNSFLRRALYESVEAEYPALICEKAGADHPNQIRVLRLNPEEQRTREERLRREEWEKLIVGQIGVWRVFMALSLASHGVEIPTDSISFAKNVKDINWSRNSTSVDSSLAPVGRKIPIIVHNGYMDLMFLLSHFHAHKLPPTFNEAKALIHSYFPTVYDTKYLSVECSLASLWNESTHLEGLFTKLFQGNDEWSRLIELVPDVQGASGFAYLAGGAGQAHDAAYDAFMTGAVYVGACYMIRSNQRIAPNASTGGVGSLKHLLHDEHDEGVKTVFGRNHLYLMQSIYSVDLENATDDPLCRGMLAESIFRISNLDPSLTTRTIVHCLSDLVDSQSNRVSFEIIWVNDATFLVAASRKSSRPRTFGIPPLQEASLTIEVDVLQEHGRLILKALKARFPEESIVSWHEYVASLGIKATEEPITWTAQAGQLLGSLFGISWQDASREGKRESESALIEQAQPERKRRRII